MGGGGWNDIPEKYKPHWSVWKVQGTPLEETQNRLAKKGLRDPWIRNEVWRFKASYANVNPLRILRTGLIPGFLIFLGIITLEKKYMPSSSHH